MNDFAYSKNAIYEHNVGILKQYTPSCFKLINMRTVRIAGFEERDGNSTGKKNTAGNTSKLRESLSRSRSKVYELAFCNPWVHFVTLTLNGEKQNRYDLDVIVHRLTKWLNNLNFREQIGIRYLLIPEPHKDDAWHFHGLMMGIPEPFLKPFSLSDIIPKHIKNLLQDGRIIYNFPLYQEKFGWVTVEKIYNNESAAKYITKYITKELMESKIALNHHVYYASQGLQRAEIICRAQLQQSFDADFENDYVKVKQFDNMNEPLQYFFE